jgi:hypothetical protein
VGRSRFPSKSKPRPNRVPIAVFVLLLLTFVFLAGGISSVQALDGMITRGK